MASFFPSLQGGFVSGLFIPSLGTAAKACKKVAAILKPDDSYILGAAAFVSTVVVQCTQTFTCVNVPCVSDSTGYYRQA